MRFIVYVFIQINQYPWLVRLGYEYEGYGYTNCGATIVASRYIISAAHCFFEYKEIDGVKYVEKVRTADDIILLIGDHDIYKRGETFLKEKLIRKRLIDKWIGENLH